MICTPCKEANHVACPSIKILAELVEEHEGNNIPFMLIDGAKSLCDCNHRVMGKAALVE